MSAKTPPGDGMLPDLCSQSNPQQVRTKSLHLALDVDFRKCTLAGTVDFTVEVMQDGAASFDLDTRELTIKGAKVEGKSVKHSASKVYFPCSAWSVDAAMLCSRC
jgi:aminopeptidase N